MEAIRVTAGMIILGLAGIVAAFLVAALCDAHRDPDEDFVDHDLF
jgi:hypothetical protein